MALLTSGCLPTLGTGSADPDPALTTLLPSRWPVATSPAQVARFPIDAAMAHLFEIVSLGPRPAGSAEETVAAEYMAAAFEGLGYEVDLEPVTLPDGGTSHNVVARQPDADPEAGYYLIGAHYDTVAGSPGANDNASGVAVMLGVAAALAGEYSPRVRFVAFAAEERQPPGNEDLVGSTMHAAEVDADRVSGMVSVDMVGTGDDVLLGRLRGSGGVLQTQLAAAALEADVPAMLTDEGLSDHVPFARRGIPAALVSTPEHPSHHSADDTVAVIEPEAMQWAGRLILQWLAARPE